MTLPSKRYTYLRKYISCDYCEKHPAEYSIYEKWDNEKRLILVAVICKACACKYRVKEETYVCDIGDK
jgi:hypothetical protein